MRSHIPLVIAAVALTTMTATVYARGPGGSGGFGGGMSPGHISQQGMQNSNGLNALDRDRGLDRAEDRMSAQGLDHSKAENALSERELKRRAAKHAPTPRLQPDLKP